MARKFLTIITFLLFTTIVSAQKIEPVDVVKASLEAYNSLDLDLFMSYFSEDVEMKDFDNGTVNAKGKEQVRAIYEAFFKASPELHSNIIDRITFDNKVMDHEYITGARGSKEAFEIVVIYEVTDGKITSMFVVRKKNN